VDVFVDVGVIVAVEVMVGVGVGVEMFATAYPPAKPIPSNSKPTTMEMNIPKRMFRFFT
jgi:hypothetical protein